MANKFAALSLFILATCSPLSFSRDGRPCEDGACLPGYVCSPLDGVCVPALALGCGSADSLCPEEVSTGDLCSGPGSFVPCAGMDTTCAAGCRTCGFDGKWSACSIMQSMNPPTDPDPTDPEDPDPEEPDPPPPVPVRRRVQLTVDGGRAPGEVLTDVPVLVRLNATRIDYPSLNPNNIAFFDSNMTPLPHALESFVPGGVSDIWVKLPAMAANAPTSFWMYYGELQTGSTLPRTDVWDDAYVGVYHLNEDGAGAVGAPLYVDDSGTSGSGLDRVNATDKSGATGLGQSFSGKDRISVPHSAPLALTSAASIEMQVQCGGTSLYSRNVTLSAPTALANQQVVWVVENDEDFPYDDISTGGANLRFSDAQGRNVPYWLEIWDTDTEDASVRTNIWLKLQDMGTDEVTMHYGNPGLTAVSNPVSVLEPSGLWGIGWSGTATTANTGDVEDEFGEGGDDVARYAELDAFGMVTNLDCVDAACDVFSIGAVNGVNQENYLLLFNGWFVPQTTGCYTFAIDSDDTAEFHLYLDDYYWKYGHPTTAPDLLLKLGRYGNIAAHGGSQWETNDGTAMLTAGTHYRVAYRYRQGGGGAAYKLYHAPMRANCADALVPTFTPVPSTSFRHRKRTLPDAEFTMGAEELDGVGVSKNGLQLICNAAGTRAAAGGGAITTNTPLTGWHHVAMTFDQANLRLFVDGVSAGTAAATTVLSLGTSEMVIGTMVNAGSGAVPRLDEVRISNVRRSDAWVATQAASQADALLTYGAPEVLP